MRHRRPPGQPRPRRPQPVVRHPLGPRPRPRPGAGGQLRQLPAGGRRAQRLEVVPPGHVVAARPVPHPVGRRAGTVAGEVGRLRDGRPGHAHPGPRRRVRAGARVPDLRGVGRPRPPPRLPHARRPRLPPHHPVPAGAAPGVVGAADGRQPAPPLVAGAGGGGRRPGLRRRGGRGRGAGGVGHVGAVGAGVPSRPRPPRPGRRGPGLLPDRAGVPGTRWVRAGTRPTRWPPTSTATSTAAGARPTTSSTTGARTGGHFLPGDLSWAAVHPAAVRP